MTLSSGARLGPYEIVAPLGAGGMGEVYKARDTRLDRSVAIKVLPEAFAKDAQFRERFDREARAVSALEHPNICPLYDVGDADGRAFLVMQFLEGETLDARLKPRAPAADGTRGFSRAIAADEAIDIARQIALGLEAAHERGVVHRDLKPANVFITRDGTAKVLDFGLAKAGAADASGLASLSMSPTIVAGTIAGVILGTAAYMSPEQARGLAVDKRTDIWAFGCVLFEMLTGKQAFQGGTVTDIIAAIVTRDPDWTLLPSDLPSHVARLLRRCLRKDPKQRLHDIADARLELEEPASAVAPLAAGKASPVSARAAWTVAAVAILVALTSLAMTMWRRAGATAPRLPFQLSVALPSAHPLSGRDTGAQLALSPDGSRLAYVGMDGTVPRLYVRRLDEAEFTMLPGTEEAWGPVFSPDGSWIAFSTPTKIKKIPALGGPAVALADVEPTGGVLDWAGDDSLLYQRRFTSGIGRLPAGGGQPEQLLTPDPSRHENVMAWPQLLADRQSLLYTLGLDSIATFDDAQIVVQSIGRQDRSIVAGGTGARVLPTGHMVFVHNHSLLAAPFDMSGRRLKGAAVPVLSNIRTFVGSGVASLAIAKDAGTLAYVPVPTSGQQDALVLADRAGHVEVLREVDAFAASELSVSPDGRRVAIRFPKANDDIHVYDFGAGTLGRLTFEAGDEGWPVWTPDGAALAYSASRGRVVNMFTKRIEASGTATTILTSDRPQRPSSFSPDGKTLAYVETTASNGNDIWTVRLDGDTTPRPFASTPFEETRPVFSPDGRWIAYESNESGQPQVYIASYPDGARKTLVSIDGGMDAMWSPRTPELFYRNRNQMMAVDVELRGSLTVSRPRTLFESTLRRGTLSGHSYGVMPDGQHFVMVRSSSTSDSVTEIRVILNWFDDLRRRVPLN